MMQDNSNIEKKSVSIILIACGLFNVISFVYALRHGKYNGDYNNVSVELNFFALLLVLIFSTLPYFVLYRCYIHYKKKNIKTHIKLSTDILLLSFFVLWLWNMGITIMYGVGKMAVDVYQAPPILTFIIQITNRLNITILAVWAIFKTKSSRNSLIIVILAFILSLARNSLGSGLLLLFVLYVKYAKKINAFIRQHFIVVYICLFLSPYIVSTLYKVRDERRGVIYNEENYFVSSEQLICGKLIGRLSSFSNLCVIIQEPAYFIIGSRDMPLLYGIQQILSSVLGTKFAPEIFPEKLMIKYVDDNASNITFMAGVPGNLLLALFKSLTSFVINLMIYMFAILYLFRLSKYVNIQYSNEFALLLLIAPLTSGVISECVGVSISLLFLFFYVIFISNIVKNTRK